MMKNILIVNKVQFGYHTDIYKWCEYLRDKYVVSEITLDMGKPKCELENVNIYYVPSTGSRLFRGIRYVLTVISHLLFFKGIIIVCYFPGCDIFKKLLPWKKMILDIRTLDVSKDDNIRKAEDSKILKASKYFDFVTVISSGLRDKMKMDHDKSAILPLGADVIKTSDKSFVDELNLLYVGTLTNRNIHDTIVGFAKAYKALSTKINLHYDIVGDGFEGELQESKKLVQAIGMEGIITLHGFIQHEELHCFFEKCNIGVSYVPITDYYEYQPVTKTFEYSLAGLYTIGTSTGANKEVINNANGILVNDNCDSFAEGIISIYERKSEIDSKRIRNTLIDYTWKNIVRQTMSDIIEKFSIRYGI